MVFSLEMNLLPVISCICRVSHEEKAQTKPTKNRFVPHFIFFFFLTPPSTGNNHLLLHAKRQNEEYYNNFARCALFYQS